MNLKEKHSLKNIFQLFLTLLIFLIIADVILMVLVLVFPIKPIGIYEIAIFDTIVSFLFLIFISINHFIFNNEYKIKYKSLVLIAIIPFESIFINILQISSEIWIQGLFFILGILHIIGLILSLRFSGSKFIEFTKKNGLGYSITIIAIIFIVSALLFFLFENQINPNVSSFEDAVWYSIVAITTTGFGDIVPSTFGGRIIGSLLMIAGVSFASFATASVASSLIKTIKSKREASKQEFNNQVNNQINELKKDFKETLEQHQEESSKEISELKDMINDLKRK